jgi:hypothetical protein
MVEPGDLVHALLPGYHYACALRATLGSIGHVQDTCRCYTRDGSHEDVQGTCRCYTRDGSHEDDPPELTKRQAARLVADYVNQHRRLQPGRN